MHSTEPTIADARATTGWRKSSYSGGSNGECLEVADGYDAVPVRDSKTPSSPALVFSVDGWSSFVSAVKDDSINA
ncbi:DUF397 domain-containing protein [Streptomyces sp. NPDC001832]|uniref:DUF397 domain-containing protein n=1 Tax=Streptomyces sp. NPDC001832 TaxID=3154527 RepID=UPI0033329F50